MSNRSKNNRKNSNKNKQTNKRKTKTSSTSSLSNTNTPKTTTNNHNNNATPHTTSHRAHASSKPIPHSRQKRNQRHGHLASEMQSSLINSTWNSSKREGIENLKLGSPYNEYNSFFSESSPDKIFNELALILKSEENLDINIHPTGYKIRGRKFINNIMCEFQIEMFYTTSQHSQYPNHILVEFQRRNGDGFVFQQFLNNIFLELQKTKIVKYSKFHTVQNCYLSPQPIQMNIEDDEKKQNDGGNNNGRNGPWQPQPKEIDYDTLKMLINALFDGDCNMRRSAATYLANNIANNGNLIGDIIKLEPLIITKFSDLLLKCVDPQIVQSIGCTLYYMLLQSNDLKRKALQSNVKTVCKKVYKRWTEPVETRYGSNNKYVIRVIPSMQVAQRMRLCIQVLE